MAADWPATTAHKMIYLLTSYTVHLVVYLLSCFDVLICLIFFLFALIKNSFIYSNVGQLLFLSRLNLVQEET